MGNQDTRLMMQLNDIMTSSALRDLFKHSVTDMGRQGAPHARWHCVSNAFRIRKFELWDKSEGVTFRIYHGKSLNPSIKQKLQDLGAANYHSEVIDFRNTNFVALAKDIRHILSPQKQLATTPELTSPSTDVGWSEQQATEGIVRALKTNKPQLREAIHLLNVFCSRPNMIADLETVCTLATDKPYNQNIFKMICAPLVRFICDLHGLPHKTGKAGEEPKLTAYLVEKCIAGKNKYQLLPAVGAALKQLVPLLPPLDRAVQTHHDKAQVPSKPTPVAITQVKPADNTAISQPTTATFDPATVEDNRKRTLQDIARREGQPAFRDSLLDAYQRKCAITGCAITSVLEAAHITPYRGPETNQTSNGLLLRSDLHTLWDKGLIYLSDDYKVQLMPGLADSEYGQMLGKMIYLPVHEITRPSLAAIRAHRAWVLGKSRF